MSNNLELAKAKRGSVVKLSTEEAKTIRKKVFHPGEHIFFKRLCISDLINRSFYSPNRVSGGQIEVPEGYQLIAIKDYTFKDGYDDSITCGYDLWYMNTKEVEVTPVYNEVFNTYDFSEPGTVVETLVEEKGPELKMIL